MHDGKNGKRSLYIKLIVVKTTIFCAILVLFTTLKFYVGDDVCQELYGNDYGVGNIKVNADKLQIRYNESVAIFSGRAVLVHNQLSLSADSIKVLYDNTKSMTPVRVEADGHVKITNTFLITCQKAVYRIKDGVVKLEGGVKASEKSNTLYGEKMTYNMKKRQLLMSGGESKRGGHSEKVVQKQAEIIINEPFSTK